LLDPERPHGMGTDFLEAFLASLPDSAEFDEDTYDLSDVQVKQQVPVWNDPTSEREEDATPGYLDLLLDIPNEWFLLVELKFSAEETGTEFYCTASQFGERLVEEYESGQYYVYLHQSDRPQSRGECFANWTWETLVDDLLEPFLAENTPRYPQRTVAQLHDLNDDIRNVAGMTDQPESEREKIELYLEHVDAITDVTETFDREWSAYSERWGRDMQESLDHNRVSPAADTEDGHPAVTVDREGGDSERWILRDSGGDWQHVFKHGWRQREESSEILEARAEDRNDLRIGFYHRMEDNRETAIRDQELRFNFRCMGSNPTEFTDIYKRRFEEQQSEIDQLLESTKAVTTGNKLTLVRGTYPFNSSKQVSLFEAYTTALNEAFTELVVENPELIQLFGELFENSISEYR
jgi:hypothetical protein